MKRTFEEMQLGSIELFCQEAEVSSFTAAANIAGVTPAAVSRSIARLEERLGVRLFVRTTRQIRLIDGGQRYYEQCRQALLQLMEAEREVTGAQAAHLASGCRAIHSISSLRLSSRGSRPIIDGIAAAAGCRGFEAFIFQRRGCAVTRP